MSIYDFIWPSDMDRAENQQLNRVCQHVEELHDEIGFLQDQIGMLNEQNLYLQSIDEARNLRIAAKELETLPFPVMLRKMWSGDEVDRWLKNRADMLRYEATKIDRRRLYE